MPDKKTGYARKGSYKLSFERKKPNRLYLVSNVKKYNTLTEKAMVIPIKSKIEGIEKTIKQIAKYNNIQELEDFSGHMFKETKITHAKIDPYNKRYRITLKNDKEFFILNLDEDFKLMSRLVYFLIENKVIVTSGLQATTRMLFEDVYLPFFKKMEGVYKGTPRKTKKK